MTRPSGVAPLAGVALAGLVGAALSLALGSEQPRGHSHAYRLLPGGAPVRASPSQRIAATPTPAATASDGASAGIWSTPAEFAPPD